MQALQCNSEASCQTFLSIPPHCTRQMLRKAGDSLGTVNGVSYKEYFDHSSHTILTPSPERYSIHDTKKEEICYHVSSIFTLNEESEVKTSEPEFSEELVQPEDDEKERGAVYVVERPDVSALREHVVTEVPSIGSQGDAALRENLKDTALERNTEFSHSVLPPELDKGDDYNFDRERSTLSDSEHSLVSSTKVEVGSQPDLGSVDASSYELVSLIGSSLVSKPLMEAQSEGKCQKKKKKTSKNLKRVSRSVPHVVPEEMQHLNDFSRAVTQEAIYAEMSSGDDAFGGNPDQYEDEEESSYSSESDDDASQANSQEIDDLAIESSSSFPAPIAPPGSETSSPDASSSAASRPTDSGSTLQDESTSRFSCGQSSIGLERLTDSYMEQLCGTSSEGLMSNILRHPEVSLSSLSPDHNTDVENSKSASPYATASASISTPTTATSRQEERECKAKRLEKLVEKLCQDFVTQNPAVKQNPATLVSYFETAGAVIRSLPLNDFKRNYKTASRDTTASGTPANKSQASSESSRVASLESIKQVRR